MKKITYLLMFMLFSLAGMAQCNYTINGADSYGDGWNGGSVDIDVAGVVTNFTLSTGSTGTLSIPSYAGDAVTFTWNYNIKTTMSDKTI